MKPRWMLVLCAAIKQRRRLTILGAVIAILLAIATPATAINWGWPDGDLHRNVGAIMFEYDGMWLPFCSGTLIGERIFLTAGHCTSGEIPEFIRVSFDEEPTLPASQLLEVEAVITHPQYNAWRPRSNNYDVGALILKEAVIGIEPATVAEIGFLDELRKAGLLHKKEEAYFTVVGYGGTLIWPPPGILWEDKRKFAFSEYQALLPSWLLMLQNVATDDDIGGTCYGDSGGPAFWEDTNGDILVALTSWGDMPTVATTFSYRADTAETHDLIALAEAWLDTEQ